MKPVFFILSLILSLIMSTSRSEAHALDPGFLELRPITDTEWRVLWRKPQVQGQPMPIDAVLPESCNTRRAPTPAFDGRAFSAAWVAVCPSGIAGGTIVIEGLENTRTDVLVRFQTHPDSSVQTKRLTSSEPGFTLDKPQGPLGVMASYFPLGVDHILEGLDHLLFVFALLLLLRGPRRIAIAVTAFTVAHSITLGAATLGYISVPVPPVEAAVALSIVILAAELVRADRGEPGLTESYPWIVAFAFGLLHGFGFATALRDIGLPADDVPLALLAFNLGVEAGQLLFIFAVLLTGFLLRRLIGSRLSALVFGSRALVITAYGIGTIASWWMITRISDFMA